MPPTAPANALYYLDTNALWQFYRNDKGTANVQGLVNRAPGQVLISPLTTLEFIGVLMKYHRRRYIKRKQIHAIVRRLRRDSALGRGQRPFQVIPLPEGCLGEAQGILLQHGCTCNLQTNDALHLGIAARLNAALPVVMVTSDGALQTAAQRRGVSWYDPETGATYYRT